jgi:choline dehydrogenase
VSSSTHFDYIVVGAGVAGCTIASEIARRELGSVLLLEAGTWPSSRYLKVPSEYPMAFPGGHAWQLHSVRQPSLANRSIPMPVGKTLGGSSAINAMIYLRGHPSDYVAWQSLAGDDWSPAKLPAVWNQMESRMGIHAFESPRLHPAMQAFLAAIDPTAVDLGVIDLGETCVQKRSMLEPSLGIARYLRCQTRGRRRSAFDFWLRELDVADRARLRSVSIRSNTLVQRFVFSSASHSVSGVQVDCGGSLENIHANKGVICCAGTIHSPRLLMASGIGNSSELASVGIEPRAYLPAVGQNLQDHLIYPVVRELLRGQSIGPSPSRDQRWEYLRSRTGVRSSNLAELGCFFRLDSNHDVASPPDYQWHVTPTHYLEYPHRKIPTNAVSIGVTFSRPKSRGSIRLFRQSDTRKFSSPQSGCILSQNSEFRLCIDPAYLKVQEDRDRMVDAVMETRQSLSISTLNGFLGDELMPGKKKLNKDQVQKSIERFATTLYHYVGTCALGKDLEQSVVDSRFRVHGLDRLWVCDASAIPNQLTGNTQATVMMMAFRLADWLE